MAVGATTNKPSQPSSGENSSHACQVGRWVEEELTDGVISIFDLNRDMGVSPLLDAGRVKGY
jgi:hypothetical protein